MGVCILIPNEYNSFCSILEVKPDAKGRVILIKCKIYDNIVILINIYSPTKDNQSAQLETLEYVTALIEEYNEYNIILGGDFNMHLNPQMDKSGGKIEEHNKYREQILTVCEEFNLVDIWRIRNPTSKIFTHREKTKIGLVQTRLDYLITSANLAYHITNTEIVPSVSSDHSLIKLKLELKGITKRGKGFWKMNNDLLTNPGTNPWYRWPEYQFL